MKAFNLSEWILLQLVVYVLCATGMQSAVKYSLSTSELLPYYSQATVALLFKFCQYITPGAGRLFIMSMYTTLCRQRMYI